VSYGPGVPPEGTCKPLGPPSYVFNQRLQSWQARQNHGRPVQEISQPNVGSSARSAFQVGHADNHQVKVILPKVKEIVVEHEASVARRNQENLSFDIRGNTSIYQKPYPIHYDWEPSLSNFDFLVLLSLWGGQ
jgi:hypothetical protein